MRARIAAAAAPYVAILLGCLVFFRKVLFTRDFVFPWDFRGYHLPLNELLASSLRDGTLPFWDPWTYCGYPQFANPQAQTFYPPALLFAAIAAVRGPGKMLMVMHWQQVLHVALAGCCLYALMRRRTLAVAPSLLGAIVFTFGGFFAMHVQHLGLVNAAAWTPVLLLAAESIPAAALAFAMVILAGFTPVVLVVVLAAFVYARPSQWPRLAAAGLLALALSAVQLLPSWELVRQTEGLKRHEMFGEFGGMRPDGFVSLVWPFAGGPALTFHYLFSSITGLALALWSRRWGLAACVALFAVLLMGFELPYLGWMHRYVPGLVRSTTYYEYFSLPFLLGFSMLAAHGAARLSGRGAWIACALAAAELFAINSGTRFNAMPRKEEAGVSPREFEGSEETLQRMRVLAGDGRIEIKYDSMNWISSASILRIPTSSGNDPLVLERHQAVRRIFADPANELVKYLEPARLDSRVMDMLGVRWLLTWGDPVQHPKWPLAAELPGHRAHRNADALPRFWSVERARVVGSLEQAVAVMRDPSFLPAEEAVVEGASGDSFSDATVRIVSYAPTQVELAVEAAGPALVVSSEASYPGWRAEIDGKPAALLMVNGAYRGITVHGGSHRVVMRFYPGIWTGLAVSGLALALCVGLIWRRGVGK